MVGEFKGTNRFRIVRRIGAGGMGVVYEAEDREREERVALKTIKTPDSDALYRFKREFRALADLVHPNLVALHELVVDDECFFTMELVHGTDFLAHVRPDPASGAIAHAPTLAASPGAEAGSSPGIGSADTLRPASRAAGCDEGRLRRALPQLVSGLSALHAAQKIHRDVKPSNILVTPEGRVVLLDFGLVMPADTLDRDSTAGALVGTVAYMAPEQARGDRITPATDFYAVGTVLYEALTGRLPFRGPLMQVLADKQQHAPAPPRAIVRGVSEDLDELCTDLLRRAPEDRPTGAVILRRLGVDTAETDAPTHTATHSGTRAAPFAGRDLELARLLQGLEDLAKMRATAIQLRGASGIGKSTLIRRFLDRAHSIHADLVVLQGRCYERESVPYQAMDSLIDDLSHYWIQLSPTEGMALLPREAALLPRLFPVLGRVPAVASSPRARDIADPQELRTRAFSALREVLQRLTEHHPLVLVLDDLQWVDANTLTVLADLMRPPDPPSLLLLLSTRSEGGQGLDQLLSHMDVRSETITLEPLPEAASARLADELLGGEDEGLAREVAREAGGNPFYIGELVRYVQSGDHAALGSLRLEEVIARRMAQLSETGRRILQLVALAGEPITPPAPGAGPRAPAAGGGGGGADPPPRPRGRDRWRARGVRPGERRPAHAALHPRSGLTR